MDCTKKSSEFLDKFDNSSNDFSVVESNFLSIEPEEEKSCEDFAKFQNSSTVDFPALVSNLPYIETEEEKSCENFDKSENCSNVDFSALLSNLPESEEEKSNEEFGIELNKCENSTSSGFPVLASNLASIEPEEEKSYEDNFDKSENINKEEFPALLVSTFPSIKPAEAEKSVTSTQEAPKFSYATMLAKKASTSPSAISAKKVLRVAASDTGSRPRTGPNITVGPKEKVVCVRGLPNKLKVVELIQALKKFGPVKLDSLQIKRFAFGSCSGTLEFQSHDSARAAVEAGKIKFGEHVGFVSFKSTPQRYG